MIVDWHPKTDHEHASAWRADILQNLEVLHATYRHHTFPRHLHEEFCICVVTQGAEKVFYQGTTYLAPAGSLVVIPPEVVHSNWAADETGWSYHVCYPSPDLFSQLGISQVMPLFHQPVIADRQLAQQFIRFHQLLIQASPQNTLETESTLLSALSGLIKRYSHPGLLDCHHTQAESKAIGQVREYLHTHYAQKIVLQDLAELTGLSPYYLSRIFQKATGLPPHAYLIQIRIIQAKARLAQACSLNCSLSEVALDLGFSDQSHFTKTFKAIVGVTPKQYQHAH